MNSYQTIDRCTEEGCECLDTAGVILYRGASWQAAKDALRLATYPDPVIVETDRDGSRTYDVTGRIISRD